MEKVRSKAFLNIDGVVLFSFVLFVKRSASWLLIVFKIKGDLTTKAQRVKKVRSKPFLNINGFVLFSFVLFLKRSASWLLDFF